MTYPKFFDAGTDFNCFTTGTALKLLYKEVLLMKSNHKYRATIYLGKDIYETLEKAANVLGVSVSQIAGVIFRTGFDISKQLDMKGGPLNGK